MMANISCQIYSRRQEIIDVNLQDNPNVWSKVKLIHEILGQGGMSSDETDGEYARHTDKKVRRVTLPWRNPALVALYQSVDSYEDAHALHLTEQGNHSLHRRFEARASTSSKRKPITQLPKNFYNQDWLKSLTRAQRSSLRLKQMLEIPALVRDNRLLLRLHSPSDSQPKRTGGTQ